MVHAPGHGRREPRSHGIHIIVPQLWQPPAVHEEDRHDTLLERRQDRPVGALQCFYRLYNHDTMYHFLHAYQQLLQEHGTLGNLLRHQAHDGLSAVGSICRYFSQHGISVVVPKDTQSACKRVCMFLRWMVRSNSPVDLGLWADFIDRRTLIMPLDTHVLSESQRLGLLKCGSATMSAARRLTQKMSEIFPDDPLKGDFALFGYGVRHQDVQ